MAELAKSKLDPPKRLAELAQRHWGELDAGTRVWDRPGAEVAALKRITLADLRAFFEVRSCNVQPGFLVVHANGICAVMHHIWLLTRRWPAAAGVLSEDVGVSVWPGAPRVIVLSLENVDHRQLHSSFPAALLQRHGPAVQPGVKLILQLLSCFAVVPSRRWSWGTPRAAS